MQQSHIFDSALCAMSPRLSPILPTLLLASFLVAGLLVSGCTRPETEEMKQADAFVAKGDAAAEAKDTLVALQHYTKATQLDSTHALAWILRGYAHGGLQQHEDAIAAMDRVIELRPDFAQAYRAKASYQISLDRLAAARENARVAIGLDDADPHSYFTLGSTHVAEGRLEIARAFFKKGLQRLDPMQDENPVSDYMDVLTQQDHNPEEIRQMKTWSASYWEQMQTQAAAGIVRTTRPDTGGMGLLSLLGAWVTLVLGILSLFRQSEEAMTEASIDRVRAWLRRRSDPGVLTQETDVHTDVPEGGAEAEEGPDADAPPGALASTRSAPATWPSTFRSLFESVFGLRHLSVQCFARSALASIGTILVVLLATMDVRTLHGDGMYAGGLVRSAWLMLLVFVFNLVTDYISLGETRWILRRLSTGGAHVGRQVRLLLVDVLLTTLILVGMGAFLALGLSFVDRVVVPLPAEIAPSFNNLVAWKYALTDGRSAVIDGWAMDLYPGLAMLASTYFTSIWVLGYVFVGLLLRAFDQLLQGTAGLARVIDVEGHPVRAMGIVLSIVTTLGFLLSAPFVL